MNRRDLLKLFSAGTIIAPVMSAAPMAILTEPAKVELFHSIPAPIDFAKVESATVILSMADGLSHAMRLSVQWGKGLANPAGAFDMTLTAGFRSGSSPACYKALLRAAANQ